jgi:hypothetical protein
MDQNNEINQVYGSPYCLQTPEQQQQSSDLMQIQQQMFYQDTSGFNPAAAAGSVPPVNMLSFQPDPDVMAFQGQPLPSQLSALSNNPMPLQIPTPGTATPTKKKTPTKSRKKADPGGQVPFKKIPDYVQKLLLKRQDAFMDKEFAERALLNLARKLASQAVVMDEWVTFFWLERRDG